MRIKDIRIQLSQLALREIKLVEEVSKAEIIVICRCFVIIGLKVVIIVKFRGILLMRRLKG